MSQKKISELLSHMMTAISGCSLYSSDHPVVDEFSSKALSVIAGLYVNDSLSMAMIGDSLLFNDLPFTEKGIHISSFIKKIKKKKIEKIVMRQGLNAGELKDFLSKMASGDPVSSSPNISVGTIEVRLKSTAGDAGSALNDGIAKVKGVFGEVSRFKSLDMVGLEDAVVDFMLSLKREINVLRIVSPVKSHSEYTYVHATNVSVLTIFQAESLGMKEESLHEVGLAGLLHDIGKMFVPAEVIEKPGKLDVREWALIKNHPAKGALYLSKLPDVPPLASIVAFEHHMRFDGKGYPETKRSSRRQHIVSQIVAMADFFDAVRAERPYHKPLDPRTVAGILREGAGKIFNPLLVDNFLASLARLTDAL